MNALTDALDADPAGTGARRPRLAVALEVLVAFGTAVLFLVTCLLIRVNPMDRLGQISGLASLELRFFLFGITMIIALVVSKQVREGRTFGMTSRLVCAAIAGLATGLVAGGLMVALRGTPWGLNGKGGDAGALASWATAIQRGEALPPTYPPLALHVLARYSDLMSMTPDLALKHLQILGVAVAGPCAYLSWRLLLRPSWALPIGVVATLPLLEPYKPFPNLVLVVFLPLAILYLKSLREISKRTPIQIARAGAGFGLVFGVLCLTYSGWFQWAAPGLFVAALAVFPWRAAWRKGLGLLALTGAVFGLITWQYLKGVLFDPAGKIADTYVYFDVLTEPTYIAMWRNDTPGVVGVWPPIGELGGVGLFTIALCVGLGLAVALGRRTTLVIGVGSTMVGAWLLRFFYARMMSETKLVQLYPRTTPLILYCLLILVGYAIYWLVQRASAESPWRGPWALVGGVCALLLLLGSTGAATADRYMPANTTPPGAGWLTWNAHQTKRALKLKEIKGLPLRWVRRGAMPAR